MSMFCASEPLLRITVGRLPLPPGLRNQPGIVPPSQGIRTGSKRGWTSPAACANAASISP
jgi:hypothetical protein